MTNDQSRELAAAQQAAEAFASGDIVFDHSVPVAEGETPPRELAEQPATVVTSLRMPLELYQRLKAAADRRGTAGRVVFGAGAVDRSDLEVTTNGDTITVESIG